MAALSVARPRERWCNMKKMKKMNAGGVTKSSVASKASSASNAAARAAKSAARPTSRYSGPSAGPSFKGGIAGAMAPRTTSMVRSLRFASGGIVVAPARSYKDMRAGAGSGVGRIQKTKIAGRGR